MSIGLEYAELQAAARTVVEGVAPLQDLLTGLSTAVESASSGFQGNAATGLGEALGAWFEVAATLGPILEGYATALVGVANEHIVNDATQTQSFQDLSSRLGGGR